MNNTRRKAIKEVMKKLGAIQEDFNLIKEELEAIKDEEEEAMYNMPESLQYTDRYYAMEEAAENLNSAFDSLESLDFEEILEYLEEALN